MKNFIFCEVVSLQILKIGFLSLKVYDSVGLDGIKLAYSKKRLIRNYQKSQRTYNGNIKGDVTFKIKCCL